MKTETRKDILDKNVVLRLSGSGATFGDPAGVEVIYPGIYRNVAGTHCIIYEECSDDNGSKTDTRSVLRIEPDKVRITKSGAVNTDLVFKSDEVMESTYDTGFGQLRITVDVGSLKIREEKHLLEADLLYRLAINNDYAEECHLLITVTD